MNVRFFKYQGTGNDFVFISDRQSAFDFSKEQIQRLCDRKFGVGADGVILIRDKEGFDFEMVYYNADGELGSMCGNGGRCAIAFAKHLGIIGEECRFLAYDGEHRGRIVGDKVSLSMADVPSFELNDDHYFLDTGSPHYVSFIDDLSTVNVVEQGRIVRYDERFKEQGTNVNFAQVIDGGVQVRTYERGVEDETLSCGTGVTAVALCAHEKGVSTGPDFCDLQVEGGNLTVRFKKNGAGFTDIWLEGPAERVYSGEIDV